MKNIMPYKGTTTEHDISFFFAPYRPGMSNAQRSEVETKLAHIPTELQKQIMRIVRGEGK